MAQKDEKLQFLGLGSMVEIDHMDALADTLYTIVARAVGKDGDGKTILRYQVAPHPQGDTPSQNIITLAESSIKKVVHEGYRDDRDESFLLNMLKKMAGAPALPPKDKKEPIVSKDMELRTVVVQPKIDDEKELLKRDPFYKFRK